MTKKRYSTGGSCQVQYSFVVDGGGVIYIVFLLPLTFLLESLSRVVAFLITLISRDTLTPPSFHRPPGEAFYPQQLGSSTYSDNVFEMFKHHSESA